jgi:glycosyltransferase involved in cell wall biosynthesis
MADVVVCTRGRAELLDLAVASILRSDHADFDLWIVDQSDDSETRNAVLRHGAIDRRVHYHGTNSRGLDMARNEGARISSSPYILFTDDDCLVEPSWLGAMLGELEADGTWAVFGRVVPKDDPRVKKGKGERHVSPGTPMAMKDSPAYRVYEGTRRDLGFGHGANMGFKRDRLLAVGGFDPLLGTGSPLRSFPERDLGYRMLKNGGRIVYTPDAVVHHMHWRSWEQTRRTYRDYAIGAGATAGKYIRCGDPAGIYILAEWLVDQGLRQIASGVLKWRSRQKVEIGFLQLVYPWVGLYMGSKYPVDRSLAIYRDPDDES